jgi:hypothetical protein
LKDSCVVKFRSSCWIRILGFVDLRIMLCFGDINEYLRFEGFLKITGGSMFILSRITLKSLNPAHP